MSIGEWMNMSKLKPAIMRRASICTAVGIAVTMGMVLMPFLVKPALADDVCYSETVNGSESTGSAPIYQLNSDCTLHIGPGHLPKIDKDNFGNNIYPIKQHNKVKHIIFDDPTGTVLNSDSSHLFEGYPNVDSIDGIDHLDVSNVAFFENMFDGLHLKEPVDLSSWNTESTTSMIGMFHNANLDMFEGIGNFSYSNDSINFQAMFQEATSNKGIDLSGWRFLNPNTKNLITSNMFDNAVTPKIDVSSFSGSTLPDASMMFANTHTDIEGISNLHLTNSVDRMFENAKPTNQVDLSSWDTKHIIIADEMFKDSDIDKFNGMDHWNLQILLEARGMYSNLNPSHEIRIQPQMPNLRIANLMFSGSNLDMFPDIASLQSSNRGGVMTRYMFENAKANYLNLSNWSTNSKYIIGGIFSSPYIKYITFGNRIVDDGYDKTADFILWSGGKEVFTNEDNSNVWDGPNLPKEYTAKKWATLPIKPECDAQFDGNPEHLREDCWDDSQLWFTNSSGAEADDELFDNTAKHYQRIFFRASSIPISFNANGVENATGVPDMKYLLQVFPNNDGIIPNNVPEDPSRTKIFDSWNTQADGKGKTYNPGDHAGHDIQSLELYAQWKDKAPNVQFNNNGGEGPTPETKPATDDNTKIAVDCTSTPSKDGSTFIGWSKTKNDVLEGSDAGEKGNIDVCGYSDNKTVKGLAGKTIDLYATWAKRPQAIFKENRPKDMTALLPATKTITGNWVVDDSTPRTYVAPNIEGWNKGYSPDGVYRFDGWMNEDGSPFTGAYLDRNDIIINAKWSRIAPAENHNHDNDNNDQNNHDNGNTNDNSGNTTDDSNTNHENNKETANNGNSDSDTTNSQQKNNAVNKPGTIPVTNNSNNQLNDSSSLFDPTPESPLNDSGESSNGSGSGYVASSNTGSPSSQSADNTNTSSGHNLAETGASIIAPIVLIIASIASATAAMVFSRMRNRRQQ